MAASWTDPRLEQIAQLLAARTGWTLDRTITDFERGFARAMVSQACRDASAFTDRLARGEGWDPLIDELAIGETYFFRSPEHFELVRETILPELMRERALHRPLRVWSAGCASGEEPYTLAILLFEAGLLEHARVLGSDVSALAIAKARAGRYREWAFRGVDASFIARYFRSRGGERVLMHEAIRSKVEFLQLNLVSDDYPSPLNGTADLDLIFCRNVLIYLDAPAIARVERKLCAALAPGGYLVPGPSDPLLGRASSLEPIMVPAGVCYKKPRCEGLIARSMPFEPPHRQRVRELDLPLPAAVEVELPMQPSAANHQLDPMLAAVCQVRLLWNQSGSADAQRLCAHALVEHHMSAELHYLNAAALLDCRRLDEAQAAVRRALYLDRKLAIAHFTLGSILERLHDRQGAERAYQNAQREASLRDKDEPVALAEDIRAGGLAAAACAQLRRLGGTP